MKIMYKDRYVFDASSGTVTLLDIGASSDYPALELKEVLMITNVTDNIIIYLFNDPDKGGTIDSDGNVITLNYDTSEMSDDDELQIFIDYGPSGTKLVNEHEEQVGIHDRPLHVDSNELYQLLADIRKELKIMNLQLALITNEHIKREEVD